MPKFFKKLKHGKSLVATSLILYLFSLFIVGFDQSFTYRYLTLFIYVLSVSFALAAALGDSLNKKILDKALETKEFFLAGSIFIFVLTLHLLYLQNYPFVSVGDEVRDAGLDALKIAKGTITNFFGYGNYGGYGNIVPTIASFFYQIFGSSVLTYRIPAAIVATLDVVLLFILLRLMVNKYIAALSALAYAALPFHMYFARTELVLAFDSFLTVIMLLALFIFLKRRNQMDYVLLGTTLGVAATFHTAVRVVAVLILATVLLLEIKKLSANVNLKQWGSRIFLLVIFCFVGFGPMVLFSNHRTFLHSNRFIYSKDLYVINYPVKENKLETVKNNYMKSLMVWVYEGTTSRYPEPKPLLTPVLSMAFIIGIGYAFFVLRKTFFNILLFFIFLLPLTNSAMTDWVNAGHRLGPLLPVAAVFIAVGMSYVFERIHNRQLKVLAGLVILFYLISQMLRFFTLLPANNDKDVKAYVSMHLVYFLQTQIVNAENVCLFVSPENHKTMNYMHYREKYAYFLPNTLVNTQENVRIRDNEAYVFEGDCPADYSSAQKVRIVSCGLKTSLFCPVNYRENIIIHY